MLNTLQDIGFSNRFAANNRRNPHSCLFPILLTFFCSYSVYHWKTAGYFNEKAIGVIIAEGYPFYLYVCFTVSVAPSIKRTDFYCGFTISII